MSEREPDAPKDPEALLGASPDGLADDDLPALLAARGQRRRIPRLTIALGALALLAVGCVGGALADHQWGSGGDSGGARAGGGAGAFARLAGTGAASGRTGAAGANGAAGAFRGAGGGATVGTVRLVDGRTLYVATPTGQIVRVRTTADTTVQVSKAGRLSQLSPGATVVVQGMAGSGGTVSATRIVEGGGLGGALGGARRLGP